MLLMLKAICHLRADNVAAVAHRNNTKYSVTILMRKRSEINKLRLKRGKSGIHSDCTVEKPIKKLQDNTRKEQARIFSLSYVTIIFIKHGDSIFNWKWRFHVLRKRSFHTTLQNSFCSTYICQYAVVWCPVHTGNFGYTLWFLESWTVCNQRRCRVTWAGPLLTGFGLFNLRKPLWRICGPVAA